MHSSCHWPAQVPPLLIALLSDIHSNIEALDACMAHAAEQGAGHVAFLGDLVGYGADPEAVIEVISSRAAQGAIVIKGNHDEAVERPARYMNDTAKEAIEWTSKVLSKEHRQYLASLPLTGRDNAAFLVHASAAAPERWDYVDSVSMAQRSAEAAQATYIFSGHVHEQALYFEAAGGKWSAYRPVPGTPVPVPLHRRWVAIVGSVGQPRDGKAAAGYALFDSIRARLTFHRVSYNNFAAAKKIRKAGLPEMLAYRVERGI